MQTFRGVAALKFVSIGIVGIEYVHHASQNQKYGGDVAAEYQYSSDLATSFPVGYSALSLKMELQPKASAVDDHPDQDKGIYQKTKELETKLKLLGNIKDLGIQLKQEIGFYFWEFSDFSKKRTNRSKKEIPKDPEVKEFQEAEGFLTTAWQPPIQKTQ